MANPAGQLKFAFVASLPSPDKPATPVPSRTIDVMRKYKSIYSNETYYGYRPSGLKKIDE